MSPERLEHKFLSDSILIHLRVFHMKTENVFLLCCVSVLISLFSFEITKLDVFIVS